MIMVLSISPFSIIIPSFCILAVFSNKNTHAFLFGNAGGGGGCSCPQPVCQPSLPPACPAPTSICGSGGGGGGPIIINCQVGGSSGGGSGCGGGNACGGGGGGGTGSGCSSGGCEGSGCFRGGGCGGGGCSKGSCGESSSYAVQPSGGGSYAQPSSGYAQPSGNNYAQPNNNNYAQPSSGSYAQQGASSGYASEQKSGSYAGQQQSGYSQYSGGYSQQHGPVSIEYSGSNVNQPPVQPPLQTYQAAQPAPEQSYQEVQPAAPETESSYGSGGDSSGQAAKSAAAAIAASGNRLQEVQEETPAVAADSPPAQIETIATESNDRRTITTARPSPLPIALSSNGFSAQFESTTRKSASSGEQHNDVFIEPIDINLLKLTNDTECNSEELRAIITENLLGSDLNSAKRTIQLQAEARFGGRFDVICSHHDFSYITNTELWCQETRESTSCYAYRQLGY